MKDATFNNASLTPKLKHKISSCKTSRTLLRLMFTLDTVGPEVWRVLTKRFGELCGLCPIEYSETDPTQGNLKHPVA